jgi:ribosomal protein S18 acetylase RimI-like enzyme
MKVRPASASDLPFLEDMLFEAAYWRPERARPGREEGLTRPDLAKLLREWGRDGDSGVAAESETGAALGAAWYRFWTPAEHSYGFVSAEVPELAIGVRADARRRGVGAALLRALLARAVHRGVSQVSLSVEIDNPALALYERVGFRKLERVGGAWTMCVDLRGEIGMRTPDDLGVRR